jgi:glyoxylase-like metal-dependent hydrolase (beta-lactamase superfamily II)
MTVAEYALARVYSATLRGADGNAAADHFRRHGITDPAQLEAVRIRGARHFASLVPSTPTSFRRIRDGEQFTIGARSWQVIVGIGHSPEHASLYSAEGSDGPLLLSGDMVLPRISTNVSVFEAEPESNPVSWYLDSLRRFEPCAEDTLVLPSHGRPFRGLHERLRQLHEHHQERLEEVREACALEPRSAADIVPIMFKREFDTHQLSFAMGEALAHLHALWYGGELRRDTGADGVIRFTPGVDAT